MSDPAGASRKPSRRRRLKPSDAIIAALIAGVATTIAALIGAHGNSPPPVHRARPTAAPKSGAPEVILRDGFCTKAEGWTVGTTKTGAHYGKCALYIYATGNSIAASEPGNGGSLPRDITIRVTARRISGSAAGDEFGIACRTGSEGYTFIVQARSVSIYRYSQTTGILGRQPLTKVPARIDMDSANRLQATCVTTHGAADLSLWVNRQKLAEAADTRHPLTGGNVGLFASTTQSTRTPTEAEFTNFVVTTQRQ